MTDAGSETPHFDLKHRYAGVPMDGGKPLRRRQRGCSHRPRNLHLDYCSHTIPVPVPGAGHHPLGKSLPISLVALDPLFPGSGVLVAGPVHGGIPRAPGVGPEPIPR